MNQSSECLWVTTSLEVRRSPDEHPEPATDGPVFYRLTPQVWGWIVRRVRSAELACSSGKLSTEQFADIKSRFQELAPWVKNRYDADELAREIATPRPLPKASTGPPPSV
jgi:hypothetical protein